MTMARDDDLIGVQLTSGPQDWQIIQQDPHGQGTLALEGVWRSEVPGIVEARLVSESSGMPVTHALDWQRATMRANHTWHLTLTNIPAGGLYRLETRLKSEQVSIYGSLETRRGDMRHFLGVGDLWVIAGQSNAAGSGRGAAPDAPQLGVHMLRPSGTWSLATHPLNDATATHHPAQRDLSNPGHSPWLRFGALVQERRHYPIGLLPTALGGSPLAAWNPQEHADPADAFLWHNMQQVIAAAGGRVRGVLWYQGETDANVGAAATYLARFSAMVAAWRSALATPDLPVLTAQLNREYWQENAAAPLGWSLVREAQRQAARQLPGIAVVPTLDLPLSDLIHISPAGNLVLAQRFADAALGMVYGLPIPFRAPDVQSARLVAVSGGDAKSDTIALTFDHVTSRLEPLHLLDYAFHVEDAHGTVPIVAVQYVGAATIHVQLGRMLGSEARVHGGDGSEPPAMPIDVERMLPALAFHDLPLT